MKPLKSIIPLARWLLRLSLAVLIFFTYYKTFKGFDFNNLGFYFAAVYVIFGALLVIGGFLSKSSLTVVSAFILFLLSVYLLIKNATGDIGTQMTEYLLPASIAFYFLSTGNDN
jgi:hypothetical protein